MQCSISDPPECLSDLTPRVQKSDYQPTQITQIQQMVIFQLETRVVIIFLFVQAICILDYRGQQDQLFSYDLHLFLSEENIFPHSRFSLITVIMLGTGQRFQAHLLANNEDIRLTGEVQCDRITLMYYKFTHYCIIEADVCVYVFMMSYSRNFSPNLLTASYDFICWPMSRHFSQADIYQQYHGMLGMWLSWIIYLITFRDFFQGRCIPQQQL